MVREPGEGRDLLLRRERFHLHFINSESFLFVYFADIASLWSQTPNIISVSKLLQPKYFRILLINSFKKKRQLFCFQSTTDNLKVTSSMIDDRYSKQMSEKKTNCVSLQLASQQSCTGEAKPQELRPV